MSSSSFAAAGVQSPAPVDAPRLQCADSPVTVEAPGSTDGNVTECSLTEQSQAASQSSAAGSAGPPVLGQKDQTLDAGRATFSSSSYILPSPPLPYGLLPRATATAGGGSVTRPSSAPAYRLVSPIPPAALQPPVPGHYLGNRPSFSYNLGSNPNASSPTGQQFQLNTVATHGPLGPRFVPLNAAALQPPVPPRPSAIFSGVVTPHPPPPVCMPLYHNKDGMDAQSVSSGANSVENPSGTWKTINPSLESGHGKTGADKQPSASIMTNPAEAFRITTSSAVSSLSLPSRSLGPCPLPFTSTSGATPSPSMQNAQPQQYTALSSGPPIVPSQQTVWLQSPASVLPRPPYQPPGGLLGPFPFSAGGAPIPTPPSGSLLSIGMPIMVDVTESQPVSSGSQMSGNASLPSAEQDKQASNFQKGDETSQSIESSTWTVHKMESGVLYYYNSVTRESTYQRPADFMGELVVASRPVPVSWEKLDGTDWSLVTTNDGKKYYYDNKNKVSSWQLPPQVLELTKKKDNDLVKVSSTQPENSSTEGVREEASDGLNAPAAQTGGRDSVSLRQSAASVSSSALDLVKKKLQDGSGPNALSSDLNGSKALDVAMSKGQVSSNIDRSEDANVCANPSDSSSDSDEEEKGPTKEECIIQFKEMLKERGVAPFSKWEKELPKIVFDPRFKAVPSHSARRAIFDQFVRTRAVEERKEKKAAQKVAVDAFKQLLEEAFPEDIHLKADFQEFKRKWSSDPRYQALDRREREVLFNERVKAAQEKTQAEHMVLITNFKAMLRENKEVALNSRWSRVKEGFRSDRRYKAVKHDEREMLFNEFIAELRKAEEESERAAKAKIDEQEKLKERERETRKRKEREEQEMERARQKIRRKEAVTSYHALLVEMIKDPKASWNESKPKLEKDPQGRAVNPDLSQVDAEKLFRDHIKDLYERCLRDYRALLGDVITAEAATSKTSDGKTVLTSWTEAKQLLKQDVRYSKLTSKDRESLWRRHVDDMMRKEDEQSGVKDKPSPEKKSRNSQKSRR